MDLSTTPTHFLAGALVALVMAGAVFWIVARRRHLNRLAVERLQPLVSAEAAAVPHQPSWTQIRISLKNRAPVAVDVVSATLLQPAGAPLLNAVDAFEDDGFGGQKLRGPLPVERAVPVVSLVTDTGRSGPKSTNANRAALASFLLYAPIAATEFMAQAEPRLQISLRWRDGAGLPFTISVPVGK